MQHLNFAHYSPFQLRRLLERLREGLYDPLAVQLLTAEHDPLDTRLRQDLLHPDSGSHLCICGAYGQGKSHTLAYIQTQALQQGYVVSAINLDPREVPLHHFRYTYRALLQGLTLPARDSAAPTSFLEMWRAWARTQPRLAVDPAESLAALLPDAMPHSFKAILVATVLPTMTIPPGLRVLARYRDFTPAEFPWSLRRALFGEQVPVARLRTAMKYRQVSFYRQASLALSNDEPFIHMVQTLPLLFRRMGYAGWVLLFDEGEAMLQGSRPMRARGYRILHRLLLPETPCPGFHAVFAFTPEFFQRLGEEDYSLPPFERDYADALRHLSVYHLRGLSPAAWQSLCATLIMLHAAAYRWPASQEALLPALTARLRTLPLQDPRTTFKGLVDELDQAQQQAFFAERGGELATG